LTQTRPETDILTRLGRAARFLWRSARGTAAEAGPPLLGINAFAVHGRDLRRPLPDIASPPGIELHWIRDEADPLLSLFPDSRRRFAARGFARGDFALVAILEGELVAYSWLAITGHLEPTTGMHVWLAPWESWGYDAWVDEDRRRSGLARVLALETMREASRRGAVMFYSAARTDNRASLAMLRLSGQKKVQTFWSLQVAERLGLQLRASPRRRPCCLSRQPRW
jgi:hypothetical protein